MIGALLLALTTLTSTTIADDALAKARSKYDAVAYDEALAILESALAQPMSNGDKARVLAFEALVHAQMADDVAATKNLDDALALDACVAIPDAPAPPKIKAMLAATKDAHTHGIPTPAAPPTTSPTPPMTTATQTPAPPAAFVAGATLVGVGVLSLALGGAFALDALEKHDAAAHAKFQSDVIANDATAAQSFVITNVLVVEGVASTIIGGSLALLGAFE